MQKPRRIKRYCPICKKHTIHNVDKIKKKKASELKQGQRRFRRVMSGYRGFPRPKPEGREKTSRRIAIKFSIFLRFLDSAVDNSFWFVG